MKHIRIRSLYRISITIGLMVGTFSNFHFQELAAEDIKDNENNQRKFTVDTAKITFVDSHAGPTRPSDLSWTFEFTNKRGEALSFSFLAGSLLQKVKNSGWKINWKNAKAKFISEEKTFTSTEGVIKGTFTPKDVKRKDPNQRQGRYSIMVGTAEFDIEIKLKFKEFEINETLKGTAAFTSKVSQSRCCSPDTRIATPTGETRIDRLRIGDLVLSDKGKAYRIVQLSKVATPKHQVCHIKLSNGRILEISPGHPLPDGRTIGEIKEGEIIDGKGVTSTRIIPYIHKYTYDILPDSPAGIYYANGIKMGSTLKEQDREK